MSTARRPVDVTVPGDKSISHRALLFAALAEGESFLTGLLDAADTRSTAAALRGLGVRVPDGGWDQVVVHGVGPAGLSAPTEPLDCGNSGTTARLLLGLLAGAGVEAVVTGDASLRQRPMRRVTGPLREAGADYQELGEPDRLPVRVAVGAVLGPIRHHNARSSAQVKTALLLAGVAGGVSVEVTEPGRSRDHSERLLRAMGAEVRWTPVGEGAAVTLAGARRLEPLTLRVPGDISSAAFFLALGALRGAVRVSGVGLNPTRTGALDVLRRMGAELRSEVTEERAGEPVGLVTVGAAPLRGTVVAAREIPTLIDEVPALAAVAARAEGVTRFEGIGELRVKETDRVAALVDGLRGLGVEADADGTALMVRGTQARLAGRVESRGDHRIAMAFGVLAALPGSAVEIDDRDVVGISYPRFWTELERVNSELEAQ